MSRTRFKHTITVACCLLLLATLLLVAACGGGYSSPGGSPQATPTKGGGYSLVWLFDNERAFFDAVLHAVTSP